MDSLKLFAGTLPAGIKQFGSNASEPAVIPVKAGKLEMIYSMGAIRYISSGNIEIIRMIYVAVRDRDWLSIIPVLSDEEIDLKSDSFHIRFTCRYASGDIDFTAQFEITGNQDESITLGMEGRANRIFEINRIGFCVLHPVENCAGKPCLITHTDRSIERTSFPEFIEPHQPFRDIRAMRWPVSAGYCYINFEGDIFETEDQRNWTDASFKTYSTPLDLPHPVIMAEGTLIKQKVEFRAIGIHDFKASEEKHVLIRLFPDKSVKLPMIGIARSTRPEPVSDAEIGILKPLRFDHYRVNLRLFEKSWQITADQAIVEAASLGAKIEFALFFDSSFEAQSGDFMKWFSLNRPLTYCFLLFHRSYAATPVELADRVIQVIRKKAPRIKIGIGTNANFAELNRNRPEFHEADLVCFSIHPQEHASDNQTLVENLKAQEYAVKSAAGFSEGQRIWVSPVNIDRRFNANKTYMEEPCGVGVQKPPADARMMSLFGACWTAISLKYLCENDPAGVTYYETVGERGIIMGGNHFQQPWDLSSYQGMIFPAYFIFKYLKKYRSFRVIKSVSSQTLVTYSLTLSDGKQVRMILTNFTGDLQNVKISGCKGIIRTRNLNSDNFGDAVSDHFWDGEIKEKAFHCGDNITLEPYSICFAGARLKKEVTKK